MDIFDRGILIEDEAKREWVPYTPTFAVEPLRSATRDDEEWAIGGVET
jgi:hypothetical protein